MSLESLIRFQLSEGLTEHELTEDIGVPKFTIHGILKGRDPKSPDIWKKLARYFHMDVNLLRSGKLDFANLQGKDEDPTGHHKPYRKVPILIFDSGPLCHGTPGLTIFLGCWTRDGRLRDHGSSRVRIERE